MKKQEQISKWLKGLCVLLAVMGLVFFSASTWFKWTMPEVYGSCNNKVAIGFTWMIAILCYAVLIEFWKVCSEIGNDNSFSLENAKSFHSMTIYGGIAMISYIFRVAYFVIVHMDNKGPVVVAGACIALCVVFMIVCESMSQLIRNAYEMKELNDLTI